jgi:hypothetical protein
MLQPFAAWWESAFPSKPNSKSKIEELELSMAENLLTIQALDLPEAE